MSREYDRVGNVTGVQTTLAAGTDNQVFCYDEQNRLVWASSQTTNGGPTCVAINTAGTLTGQGRSTPPATPTTHRTGSRARR